MDGPARRRVWAGGEAAKVPLCLPSRGFAGELERHGVPSEAAAPEVRATIETRGEANPGKAHAREVPGKVAKREDLFETGVEIVVETGEGAR